MNEMEGWATGFIAFFAMVVLCFTQGVRCNRDNNAAQIKKDEQLARMKIECVRAGRPALECDMLRLP